MRKYTRLYIDGGWVRPSGSRTLDVVNSTTEEVMGEIPEAEPADVDRAVAAARGAFESWSTTSPAERAEALTAIAEGIKARDQEIAKVIAQEVGAPTETDPHALVGVLAIVDRWVAELAREFPLLVLTGRRPPGRAPIRAAARIRPRDVPLHPMLGEVAPALAAGCTVVLKPSEVA
ncbi:MAG: aldehyde dehydrogenase family protein, partial [bacterium]|nr:aldehyde dehydrogenase family protein [bacterium]